MKAPETKELHFPPYRLDLTSERLYRGSVAIPLRRKTWNVLRHLVENAHRLISKEELFDVVWAGATVSDTMPGSSVAEIRRALQDDPKRPRYVETAHGRGFRFIAEVIARGDATPARSAPGLPSQGPHLLRSSGRGAQEFPDAGTFVGRVAELEALAKVLEESRPGCRLAFLTGEAGIGKTSLLQMFIRLLEGRRTPPAVGWGRCSAYYGEGDPFVPVLEALEVILQSNPGGEELLRRHAPTWLVQLPAHLSPGEDVELRARIGGATPHQMRLELILFLRACGPVVLAFDDLHWADRATIELLAFLGEYRDPLACTLIGTFRPGEAIATGHPVARLKRDLHRRRQCWDIPLGGLTGASVGRYVAARFPAVDFPEWASRRLLERTDGNPFFLETLVDHLEGCGVLGARMDRTKFDDAIERVPDSLREALEQLIDESPLEDRRLLDAASVAGEDWDAATVAAVLERSVVDVDQHCRRLVERGSFLQMAGERHWPDGTVSGHFRFSHALYRQVLYDRLTSSFRVDSHRRIGAALSRAFGDLAIEIASEIAYHLERGRDRAGAIRHHRLAARSAAQRFASREVVLHWKRALVLQREDPARNRRSEIEILTELGKAATVLEGFHGSTVRQAYEQASGLASQGEEVDPTALAGVCHVHLMQHDLDSAEKAAQQLLDLTAEEPEVAVRTQALLLMGTVLFHRGEVREALEYQRRCLELGAEDPVVFGFVDLTSAARSNGAISMWLAGDADGAARWIEQALIDTRRSTHPFNRALALQAAAVVFLWREDTTEALRATDELAALLVQEPDLRDFRATAAILGGRARLAIGNPGDAVRMVREGLCELQDPNALMNYSFLLCTAAEVLLASGDTTGARGCLENALRCIENGGESYYEAEIRRVLHAVHVESGGGGMAARRLLARAVAVAERQGAKGLLRRLPLRGNPGLRTKPPRSR